MCDFWNLLIRSTQVRLNIFSAKTIDIVPGGDHYGLDAYFCFHFFQKTWMIVLAWRAAIV